MNTTSRAATRLASSLLLAGSAAAVLAAPFPAVPEAVASAEDLARGQRVLQDFCLSCHVLEAGRGNPLRPRLKPDVWGDPDKAYANIGNLLQLSRSMNQPFRGTDEDRRALAAALAALARGNRVPAWRAALPYVGLAAAVGAAGAFLAWARRRERGA